MLRSENQWVCSNQTANDQLACHLYHVQSWQPGHVACDSHPHFGWLVFQFDLCLIYTGYVAKLAAARTTTVCFSSCRLLLSQKNFANQPFILLTLFNLALLLPFLIYPLLNFTPSLKLIYSTNHFLLSLFHTLMFFLWLS